MRGLLFSQMEPPARWEADFHDWYEQEHIPARMILPGFESALRYEALEGEPRFLACYHLSDLAVLRTPEYRRLKEEPSERTARMLTNVRGFTRYVCDLVSDTGPAAGEHTRLFVVAFSVPPEHRAEFDGWYEDEHVPMLMDEDGWLRVRRYTVRPGVDGPPWTHLALHDLADESALTSPARIRARDTERRARVATHRWFGDGGRWLYRPISVHTAVAERGG